MNKKDIKRSNKMKVKRYKTQRGFTRIDFKDKYGIDCSMQESSNVTPSVWLGTNENRMILDKKMAWEIANRLLWFVFFWKSISYKVGKDN